MNLTAMDTTFQVGDKRKKIVDFDPFVTYNDLAKGKVDANALQADYLLLSHGHQDHIADAVSIATRTGATVIANAEVSGWISKQGDDRTSIP